MRRHLPLTSLALVAAVFLCSCGDGEPTGPSQDETDGYIGYGIVTCCIFIWDQNIAGSEPGPIDMTVPGPLGGTVHIFGTTGSEGPIQTCDLTYEMAVCESLDEFYHLSLTGNLAVSGTWSTEYVAMGYTSDMLTFTGTAGPSDVAVDETGPVSITRTTNGLSGMICGREFAYSY